MSTGPGVEFRMLVLYIHILKRTSKNRFLFHRKLPLYMSNSCIAVFDAKAITIAALAIYDWTIQSYFHIYWKNAKNTYPAGRKDVLGVQVIYKTLLSNC